MITVGHVLVIFSLCQERTRSIGLHADLFTHNILTSAHERLAERSIPRAWRCTLVTLHNFEDLELEAEPGLLRVDTMESNFS